MSRSSPQLQNPSQHFFEWKGGAGTLEFWDKELEKRVTVPLPFEFLPLDQLATITGFSKTANGSYYSNEVRNTAKEPLTVKLKGQTVFTGLYKNEQGMAQVPKGASYAKSIYIAHKTKSGEYIIGNLKASGSALGAWIEFTNKHSPESGKVTINRGEKQTSPVGDFYAPTFTYSSSTDEENEEAIRLDRELQVYLSQYFMAPIDDHDSVETDEIDDTDTKATPEQLRDFEQRKAKLADKQDDDDIKSLLESLPGDDKPINPDDIPF
jgi:hypothetical protein